MTLSVTNVACAHMHAHQHFAMNDRQSILLATRGNLNFSTLIFVANPKQTAHHGSWMAQVS